MREYYCHYEEIWKPANEYNYLMPIVNRYEKGCIDHFKEISYEEIAGLLDEFGSWMRVPRPRAICIDCELHKRTLDEKYKNIKYKPWGRTKYAMLIMEVSLARLS